jgi:hypothetical protein
MFGSYYGYCCKIHDKDYILGKNKIWSDFRLGCCVAISGPWYKFPLMLFVGLLMFLGTVILGWPFYWYSSIKRWWKNRRS